MNRVNGRWFDQMERCGHLQRTSDLALFHDLGLKKLRYGLPWERLHAAGTLDVFEAHLNEMRRLELDPIAGLVHHGSGPEGTSLLDPDFGKKLAGYAFELARRYPWIQSYTPINEPQTTARFSGLHGHWYPHQRSYRAYLRSLVHQLQASVLAMRAVRSVRSDTIFIHTEDAGKTWSTSALAEDCYLREQRRWLGMDLLCGMVDERHPLYPFLAKHGLTQHEILWFAENPCPPDIVGLNHYVTSDRFLDHRVQNYPPGYAGGDIGDDPFVDVEAVRVRSEGIAGAGEILTDAWTRYGLPVAITEAHLGGSAADQILWLVNIWNEARAARSAGVNCVAVTVWALLGSFDWCSLVTRDDGIYEPGVFDLSTGTPLPTELAGVVERLARGEILRSNEIGWWARPDRLTFGLEDPT